MKVGISLSRCVKDIYKGDVDIYDVLVIIARTDFDPDNDDHWKSLWKGYAGGRTSGSLYSQPEWSSIPEEDEQAVRDICIKLKKLGKLHQPRQYGAHTPRLAHHWYDLVITDENLQNNPGAKKAWNNYKMIAGLIK